MSWALAPTTKSTGSKHVLPVISVVTAAFQIVDIHFATPSTGRDFHYLYQEANTQPNAPVNLRRWGLGPKIVSPEWNRYRVTQWAACFTALRPIAMRVRLVLHGSSPVAADRRFRLWVSPLLEGSDAHLTRNSVEFTLPGGSSEADVDIATAGQLPDEISRFSLSLRWAMTSLDGSWIQSVTPATTSHTIFCIQKPLDPAYDSPLGDTLRRQTTFDEGTLTGTKKRLDLLTLILGGPDRRSMTDPLSNIDSILWNLHVGINDTPNSPPFFDANHDRHLTGPVRSSRTGGFPPLPDTDQWLAWCPTPAARGVTAPEDKHWNDASCAGHVQLLKTMAASVGLFARRAWIFPHTSRLPDGTTLVHVDADLYSLGEQDLTKQQTHVFTYHGMTITARCMLMEPGFSREVYEACLRTPSGKFLPGGYNTSSTPDLTSTNPGFNSAAELIRWWSRTQRRRWRGRPLARPFQRFMAWVGEDHEHRFHAWDVDGTHYHPVNFERIRNRGKQLPAP